MSGMCSPNFLLIELDQAAAMADLLLAHFFKHLRRAGKVFPQIFAKVGVDAFVLFLKRNRQGQDFFLRQTVEVSHVSRRLRAR